MNSHAIGMAVALALSTPAFAQSSGSTSGSVGTGSIIGTPPSAGTSGATSGSVVTGPRCDALVGADRERCMRDARASVGSSGATGPGSVTGSAGATSAPPLTPTPIPNTGTTGSGSTGIGSGTTR